MMTYQEVLTAIHSRKAFSTGGATLNRIRRLLGRLGNPQNQYKTVHVAGTNGKGSVSAMVAAALKESGYKTGLFTSPYLVDFRERIQIDGELISEEMLVDCFETVMAEESLLEQDGLEPINEFELVTAIGFLAFARAKVDYAVIEVGLGGRFDATNVLMPDVACITPVSLDHTAVLGNTVAEIAKEKAGIIKPSRPVVLVRQQTEALAVFRKEAQQQGSPLHLAEEPKLLAYSKHGIRFSYDGAELSLPLLGRYQMDNAAAAWEVCKLLGLPKEAVRRGFSTVRWPGRLQYIPGPPELLIDAGHNPAGITALCAALDELFPEKEIITVMAMMGDKDYETCIPMIAGRSKVLIAATVVLPRSLPPEELAREAGAYCETRTAASVAEGIALAKAAAGLGDLILVCGSVYAAGDALRTIS